MKKTILLLFVSLTLHSFAQEKLFSFEASYPLPFGDTFVNDNYSGIIDAGLKYRFYSFETFNIGAAFNGGYLRNTKDDTVMDADVKLFTLQPKFFVELDAEDLQKFHPSIGVGYTFLNFKVTDMVNPDNPGSTTFTETESGFNINVGLLYDLTNKLFVQVQYDLIKLKTEDGVPDIPYNKNIHLLKFGLWLYL